MINFEKWLYALRIEKPPNPRKPLKPGEPPETTTFRGMCERSGTTTKT